ncbi:hypothetical protein SNEBB_005675 [Seison nebaliae]|nr:hypothetical protein SNEBB_005675 [Seison nebaliae]
MISYLKLLLFSCFLHQFVHSKIVGSEESLKKKYCPFSKKEEDDIFCGDIAATFNKHVKLTKSSREDFLAMVNEKRRDAEASDMSELEYNLSLESLAIRMSWRNKSEIGMIYDFKSKYSSQYKAMCISEEDPKNNTLTKIFKKRVEDDKDNFEYGKPVEKPSKETGSEWEKYTHEAYRFIVYAKSYQIGCGITEHGGTIGQKICCVIYHRTTSTKEYKKGKSCAKCPGECPCKKKLCRCNIDSSYITGTASKFYVIHLGVLSVVRSRVVGRPFMLSLKLCPKRLNEDDPMCGGPSSTFKKHIKLKDKERNELVDYVNLLRSTVNSSNIQELVYQMNLEAIAQRISWRNQSEDFVTYHHQNWGLINKNGNAYCFRNTDEDKLHTAYEIKVKEDKPYFKNTGRLRKPGKHTSQWKNYIHQSYSFVLYAKLMGIGCGVTEHKEYRRICCVTMGDMENGKTFKVGNKCSDCSNQCPRCIESLCKCPGAQSKIYGKALTLSNKLCNEDSPETSPICGKPNKNFDKHIELSDKERQKFLDYVNGIRRGVNATNMIKVEYSMLLEALSQRAAWRERSHYGVTDEFNMDDSQNYVYCFETSKKTLTDAYTANAATDKKYFKNKAILVKPKNDSAEWKDYIHQSYLFILHFSTKLIGCGMTEIKVGKGVKVCCSIGNEEFVEGKAYSEGEECSDCPKGCKTCSDGLCKCKDYDILDSSSNAFFCFGDGIESKKIIGRPLTLSLKLCEKNYQNDDPICGVPSKTFDKHVKLTDAERTAFVDYVNEIRSSVNSSNMNNLYYSFNLEAMGQRMSWRNQSENLITYYKLDFDRLDSNGYCFGTEKKKKLLEAYKEEAKKDKSYFKNEGRMERPEEDSKEWKRYTHQSYSFLVHASSVAIGCGVTDHKKERKICCVNLGDIKKDETFKTGEACDDCSNTCSKCTGVLCKCPVRQAIDISKSHINRPSILILLTFFSFYRLSNK